jgi:hypothetical protein
MAEWEVALRRATDDEREEVRSIAVAKAANLSELLPADQYAQVLSWIESSIAGDLGYAWPADDATSG